MKVIEYKKDINNLKKNIDCKINNNELVILNLGGGSSKIENAISIDLIDHTNTDFVLDLLEMELNNECVDVIHAHHIFEHFYRFDAVLLLEKWYKWLKNNGQIFISVPDSEEMLRLYCNKKYSFKSLMNDFYRGECNNNEEANNNRHWRILNSHKFGYSHKTLEELLRNIGFKNIKKIKPPHGRDIRLNIAFSAKK